MYVTKWHTLAASGGLQLAAGAAYTFSLYAPSLKEKLQLSQTQLEGVGSALLCGGLFAWAPGFVYDALTPYHKLGPRLSGFIGVLFHFCGYFLIWAGASGVLHLPYWMFIAAGLVASNSLLWLDTTSVVTCMRNFPNEQGSIAGILKTFLGLSASLLATIYGTMFTPDGIRFILFLAVAPSLLALLLLPLANHVPHIEDNETKHGKRWLTTEQRLLVVGGLVALLLLYQLVTALVGQVWSISYPSKVVIMYFALLLLAAALAMLLVQVGSIRSKPAELHGHNVRAAGEGASLLEGGRTEQRSPAGHEPAEEGDSVEKERPRHWNLAQCLVSFDYWALWLAEFIGIGSGFTFLNNLGCFAVLAVSGCFIALLCPAQLDFGLLDRTAVLLAMSVSNALTYALIAVAGLPILLPLAMLAGLVFGAHWALMPSCTTELFGSRHFAANQSIIHLATAVGALVLSTELAGNLYQHQGRVHGDPEGFCYGSDCFRWTFVIIAACALLQSVLSGVLYIRSRLLYRRIHHDLKVYQQEANA